MTHPEYPENPPESLTTLPAIHRRYDEILRALAVVGRGRTLGDLGDAYALAVALEAPAPDAGTVAVLTARLGLLREAVA